MLKHLVIQPRTGWCGRIRVIYSGLKVAEQFGAKLTIVFPEGDLRRLITLPDEVEVIATLPDLTGYKQFTCNYHRVRYDFSKMEKVFFHGLGRFEDMSFPSFELSFYADYIHPSIEVIQKSDALKKMLMLPDDYVGMHVRRGDHQNSIRDITDRRVIRCIEGILAKNPREIIVLGCEDSHLNQKLQGLYPGSIIVATLKESQWNDIFSINEVLDDYAELILLSRGRYVVGCESSAYSRMIIAYNGDTQSFMLGPGRSYCI